MIENPHCIVSHVTVEMVACMWFPVAIIQSVMSCVLTEFIEGVSQFSVKGDKLSKLRCEYSTPCVNSHKFIHCCHKNWNVVSHSRRIETSCNTLKAVDQS